MFMTSLYVQHTVSCLKWNILNFYEFKLNITNYKPAKFEVVIFKRMSVLFTKINNKMIRSCVFVEKALIRY